MRYSAAYLGILAVIHLQLVEVVATPPRTTLREQIETLDTIPISSKMLQGTSQA